MRRCAFIRPRLANLAIKSLDLEAPGVLTPPTYQALRESVPSSRVPVVVTVMHVPEPMKVTATLRARAVAASRSPARLQLYHPHGRKIFNCVVALAGFQYLYGQRANCGWAMAADTLGVKKRSTGPLRYAGVAQRPPRCAGPMVRRCEWFPYSPSP